MRIFGLILRQKSLFLTAIWKIFDYRKPIIIIVYSLLNGDRYRYTAVLTFNRLGTVQADTSRYGKRWHGKQYVRFPLWTSSFVSYWSRTFLYLYNEQSCNTQERANPDNVFGKRVAGPMMTWRKWRSNGETDETIVGPVANETLRLPNTCAG